MYTALAERRTRFNRETIREDYASQQQALDLIRAARGTTPPPVRRRRMPTEDKLALAVAVAFLVALVAGG